MIIRIVHFALLVRDYDEAMAFYCDLLGFIVTEDSQLQNKRWVRIALPCSEGTEILLSKTTDDAQTAIVGNQAGGRVLFFMHSDDLDADYKRLIAAGVTFSEVPRTESYGKVAVLKDLYGNRIDLIQRR